MSIKAPELFYRLAAAALVNIKPSKTTIVDGRHVETEDERTSQWRNEVCLELAELCVGATVEDDLADQIEAKIAFAPNFLSVGSRAALVLQIKQMVCPEALTRAAE